MNDLLKSSPVLIAVLLFIIVSLVLYYVKPKMMFDNNGETKEFGFDDGQTIFTYPIVLIVLAVFTYLITFIVVSLYNN
tara:strand:- start:250 stop:483 length:234 start_codon:yes stop_codon:yes gene_type:complete